MIKAFISNHKKNLFIFFIAIILIVITGIIFILSQLKFSADQPFWTDVTEGALKVGKYYVDGDTSQYYLEVTEEGTIQLKGVDYYEYASYNNDQASEDMIAEMAGKYATAWNYLVAYYPSFSDYKYFLFTDYKMGESTPTGTGYIYIDENTILRSAKENAEIFIYRDENSPQTFSAPDKITRIVDAIHTEE